jgi:hypothetical protein
MDDGLAQGELTVAACVGWSVDESFDGLLLYDFNSRDGENLFVYRDEKIFSCIKLGFMRV